MRSINRSCMHVLMLTSYMHAQDNKYTLMYYKTNSSAALRRTLASHSNKSTAFTWGGMHSGKSEEELRAIGKEAMKKIADGEYESAVETRAKSKAKE